MPKRAAVCFLLLSGLAAWARPESGWGGFFERWKSKGAPAAPAVGGAVARAGALEVQLVEGGFSKNPKTGAYYPTARLNFKNADPKRAFKRTVTVEFIEAGSLKSLAKSSTFLSLKSGQSLSRLYGSMRRLSYASPEAAPAMGLRVRFGKVKTEILALPAIELSPAPPAPAEGRPQKVERVADGDTLVLAGGERVRLLGVDTPELVGQNPRRTCFGNEAAFWVRTRISGTSVRLEYDGDQRDIYGRVLAYVWLEGGSMLNRELLEKGMARLYRRADFRFKSEFKELEAKARKARLGLWAACAEA